MKTTKIVVLNDGSTYSSLEGCRIIELTEKGVEQLEVNGDLRDVKGREVISSREITN